MKETVALLEIHSSLMAVGGSFVLKHLLTSGVSQPPGWSKDLVISYNCTMRVLNADRTSRVNVNTDEE
jgi:hypothetical protein